MTIIFFVFIPVTTKKITETTTTTKTTKIQTTAPSFTTTPRPEVVEEPFEISSGSGSGYVDSDDEDIYTSRVNPVTVNEQKPVPERPIPPPKGTRKKPYESTTFIVPHFTPDFNSDNTDLYFPTSNSESATHAPYDPYKNNDREISDKTTKNTAHSSSAGLWSMQCSILLIVSCGISTVWKP